MLAINDEKKRLSPNDTISCCIFAAALQPWYGCSTRTRCNQAEFEMRRADHVDYVARDAILFVLEKNRTFPAFPLITSSSFITSVVVVVNVPHRPHSPLATMRLFSCCKLSVDHTHFARRLTVFSSRSCAVFLIHTGTSVSPLSLVLTWSIVVVFVLVFQCAAAQNAVYI